MPEITSSEIPQKSFQFNADQNMALRDRDLLDYQHWTRFNVRDIVQHGAILNLGSGITQLFEQDVKRARPDIDIISVDPSTFQTVEMVAKNPYELEKEKHERRTYLQEHGGGHTLDAYGQELPIKNDSIDVALDVFGPAYYLRNKNLLQKYIREVRRTLKSGATFRIGTIKFNEQMPKMSEVQQFLDHMNLTYSILTTKSGKESYFGAVITKGK